MKNLFVIMLLLIGAAAALFIGLVVLHPNSTPANQNNGNGPTANQPLIPNSIPGFTLQKINRVDPIFPGEQFSVNAVFTPTQDSPYTDAVASMGVTVFHLSDISGSDQIKSLLLLGSPISETIGGVPMQYFLNTEASLAGMLWQKDVDIYYVLASGPDGKPFNKDQAHAAVEAIAKAIVGGS